MPRAGTLKTDFDKARAKLNSRRRKSKLTLFRKAHRMHVQNGMEVFVLIHRHDDDRYRLYTSQPNTEWPPPLQKIEKMYPVPEIWTPENIAPLFKANPAVSLPQKFTLPTPPGPDALAGIDAPTITSPVEGIEIRNAPVTHGGDEATEAFFLPYPSPVHPLGRGLPGAELGLGAVAHGDDDSDSDDDGGRGDDDDGRGNDDDGRGNYDDVQGNNGGFTDESFINLYDKPTAPTEALSTLPATAPPTTTKAALSRREATPSRLRSIVVEIP